MRCALADTIAHVVAAGTHLLRISEADVAEGLSEIRAHRVVPGVFGRYYDMVFAYTAGRHDEAQNLLRELL